MIKKILVILVAMLLLGYIAFAAYFFAEIERDDVCSGINIIVVDSLKKHFVTESDIASLLKRNNLYPVNKPVKDINTEEIEKCILTNEMIASVEAYKTPSGGISLAVEQKIPILRIMTVSGQYYIDNKGSIMPVSSNYVVNVPIASGYIEKEFATSSLYDFSLFLEKNDFWNGQIEQIYVYQDGDIELIPRVGDHKIILGTFEDYKMKLRKMQLFYEKIVPKMGWEKYSIINLKYKNQIVCTKR